MAKLDVPVERGGRRPGSLASGWCFYHETLKENEGDSKTDELGFNIVEDKVHVQDLQATLPHC